MATERAEVVEALADCLFWEEAEQNPRGGLKIKNRKNVMSVGGRYNPDFGSDWITKNLADEFVNIVCQANTDGTMRTENGCYFRDDAKIMYLVREFCANCHIVSAKDAEIER